MKKILSKFSKTPLDRSKPHHTGRLFIEQVPSETLRQFKARCAYKETTMRDVILQFMWEYIPSEKRMEVDVPKDISAPEGRGAFLLEGIPSDTKTSFKVACAKKKQSQREAILAFMWMFAHGLEGVREIRKR